MFVVTAFMRLFGNQPDKSGYYELRVSRPQRQSSILTPFPLERIFRQSPRLTIGSELSRENTFPDITTASQPSSRMPAASLGFSSVLLGSFSRLYSGLP